MRFLILLSSLALLPLLVVAHGWIYTERQLPGLQQQVMAALIEQGIVSAVAEVQYLDLRIAGDVPDPAALVKARTQAMAIKPLRLVKDELRIPASLGAHQEDETLILTGWLPEEQNIREVSLMIRDLRPDLTVNTDALRSDAQVRWLDDGQGPVTANSRLMAPILENLKVATWLEMVKDESGIKLAGLVPADGVRAELLRSLEGANARDLKETPHAVPSGLSETKSLSAFVRAFFTTSSKRRFSVNKEGELMIEGPATQGLVKEWSSLLKPVAAGKRVEWNVVFYPSEYHFPNAMISSPVPEKLRGELVRTFSRERISFIPDSEELSTQEQAKLASLTPLLVTAGPAVKLLIGGHPDPEGNTESERKLALARANEVHSFLVEQGLPASDVQAVAFDPVPAGTQGAPENLHTVEILIR
jgi:energy-converting hydrogenase Eha subunit C/flagellar motor protein MotB